MSQGRKIGWRWCNLVILALLAGPGWSAAPARKARATRARAHTPVVAQTPPHVGAAIAAGQLRVVPASTARVSGLGGGRLPRRASAPAAIGGAAAFDARKGGGMISGSIVRHRP